MKGPVPKVPFEAVKKLIFLGEKQGTISLKDLAFEMNLSMEDTLVFLRELFPAGAGVEVYSDQDQCMVEINAQALQYMLPLNPSEWMVLHQILSETSNSSQFSSSPALDSLKKKIISNGPVKAVMGLLAQLDQWDAELTEKHRGFVSLLDEAVKTKSVMELVTLGGRHYQIFPSKIIHLEGKLSIIGEDINDHCLLIVPVHELEMALPVASTKSPKVSAFEVDEFIVAIRSMSEKETRLILKIHDPQSVNLFPEHHFLGKPCMISNPNGDLIWAAYVEPCEDLYEWLISLEHKVEILDPLKFKDEYLMYLEAKLRKVA